MKHEQIEQICEEMTVRRKVLTVGRITNLSDIGK